MSAVAELEASLEALRALKPPGVTKSRISSMTNLCTENVKSESVLVQKIYTCFKKTPATHKLGVLYVVDSVARTWMDRANAAGQKLSGSVQDGTFAAGVQRINDLLPSMMNDLISKAPDDQKDKIGKLIDIWERGGIFNAGMVVEFKSKMNARVWKAPESTTPPGSPPRVTTASNIPAKTLTAQSTQQSNQSASQILSTLAALSGQAQSSTPSVPQPSFSQPNAATSTSTPSTLPQASAPAPVADISTNPLAALAPLLSILPPSVLTNQEQLASYIQILQRLQSMGVPQAQWGDVIKALQDQQGQNGGSAPAQTSGMATQPLRNRSRSPTRNHGSPFTSADQFRQRSPARHDSPSLNQDKITFEMQPKWIDYDNSLPPNHIKVLSRTLFVGGTTCSEGELRPLFAQFGEVQTVIAHPEKRHAFVKMCQRKAAEDARVGLDDRPANQGKLRSVRWGVGFGPRECNDYTTGVAIIPIDRLTEADRKWVQNAEYGGTGGKPLTSGMCMEEPDIEIGAGVSSKALSDRQGGFAGRAEGGRERRGGGREDRRDRDDNRRGRGRDQQQSDRDNGRNAGPPQQELAYGIPNIPQQQQQQQPPPPGMFYQNFGMPAGQQPPPPQIPFDANALMAAMQRSGQQPQSTQGQFPPPFPGNFQFR